MTKKPHHHGNLRAALIEAGLEILRESGLAGLTLRGAAARAGVSHAAPAHHFDGLPGLMQALAAQGWAQFSDIMRQDRAAAPTTPRGQLLGICNGYLRFAHQEPALFALIFNTDIAILHSPEVEAESRIAYAILQEACAPFAPISPSEGSTELMVWSLVHGLACLQSAGHVGSTDLAQVQEYFAEILPQLPLR